VIPIIGHFFVVGGFSYVSGERRAEIGQLKFWVILGEAVHISVELDIF